LSLYHIIASSGGSRGGRRGRSPLLKKINKIKREREREKERERERAEREGGLPSLY
jgi:hypothetical protein